MLCSRFGDSGNFTTFIASEKSMLVFGDGMIGTLEQGAKLRSNSGGRIYSTTSLSIPAAPALSSFEIKVQNDRGHAGDTCKRYAVQIHRADDYHGMDRQIILEIVHGSPSGCNCSQPSIRRWVPSWPHRDSR